jgi:hypothetical protein
MANEYLKRLLECDKAMQLSQEIETLLQGQPNQYVLTALGVCIKRSIMKFDDPIKIWKGFDAKMREVIQEKKDG